MATPKKRTSKTRKNLRKSQWKAKASIEAKKALAKSFKFSFQRNYFIQLKMFRSVVYIISFYIHFRKSE